MACAMVQRFANLAEAITDGVNLNLAAANLNINTVPPCPGFTMPCSTQPANSLDRLACTVMQTFANLVKEIVDSVNMNLGAVNLNHQHGSTMPDSSHNQPEIVPAEDTHVSTLPLHAMEAVWNGRKMASPGFSTPCSTQPDNLLHMPSRQLCSTQLFRNNLAQSGKTRGFLCGHACRKVHLQ